MEGFGLVILVPAAAIHLWCAGLLVLRGRGTPLPIAPPRGFGAEGPYLYTRNPMALSVIPRLLGLSLLLRSPLRLAASAGVAMALHLYITRREEPEIARRFGAPYVDCGQAPVDCPAQDPSRLRLSRRRSPTRPRGSKVPW